MSLARSFVFIFLTLSGIARAQAPSEPKLAPQSTPAPPTLTTPVVLSLIKIIPELAKITAELNGPKDNFGIGILPISPEMAATERQRIETLIKEHQLTLPDFFMQLAALFSTYLALSPEEFDKNLPREDSPQIKQLLEDPKIPQAKKNEIRRQIAELLANKEKIRAQTTLFATSSNRAVVKPLLAKVKQAITEAEQVSGKATIPANTAR